MIWFAFRRCIWEFRRNYCGNCSGRAIGSWIIDYYCTWLNVFPRRGLSRLSFQSSRADRPFAANHFHRSHQRSRSTAKEKRSAATINAKVNKNTEHTLSPIMHTVHVTTITVSSVSAAKRYTHRYRYRSSGKRSALLVFLLLHWFRNEWVSLFSLSVQFELICPSTLFRADTHSRHAHEHARPTIRFTGRHHRQCANREEE